MTLYELWLVIKRQWKLVVALPVACLLACGGWLAVRGQSADYEAQAQVVANSQAAYVAGAATAEAASLPEGVSASAKSDASTMTVTVTATGADPAQVVEAANAVAESANSAAEEAFAGYENPYVGIIVEAEAASSASSDSAKYLLVAVLAGLFLAVCAAVALDMRNRPVKTPEGAQEATELPVLEILPARDGERLLANVRFASGAPALRSVLVVPAGDVEIARLAADLLASAAAAEGAELDVSPGRPLSEAMESAYAARDAGAVVVAARQWADSLPALESAVAELNLAGANLAGVVFAYEKLA